MSDAKEKLKALQLTIDKLEKTYGKGTVMKLNDQRIVDIPAISTGSIGLDIALGRPAFVTEILPETNTVVLGEEADLNRTEMKVTGLNWIKYDGITDGMEAVTKIRYKDKGALSNLYTYENGIIVRFYDDVKGVAPGQSAVFYERDDVIGGGIIQRAEQLFSL